MILAIICTGLITYSLRFMPFLLIHLSPKLKAIFSNQKIIAPMGPCLIAAIAATSISPSFVESVQTSGVSGAIIFLAGLFGALVGYKISKNAGLGVIIGILCFAIAKYFI